jgi:uridine kinase
VGIVVVEGVGASRRSLAPWLDAAVWVQSDEDEAYRRGIERDVRLGRTRDEVVALWDEWMAEEVPFLAADRPWKRADIILCGTPDKEIDGLLVSRARAGPGPRAQQRW